MPAAVSVGFGADLAYDGTRSWPAVLGAMRTNPRGPNPIWAACTDDELRERTLETMTAFDMRGVVSGPPELVRA